MNLQRFCRLKYKDELKTPNIAEQQLLEAATIETESVIPPSIAADIDSLINGTLIVHDSEGEEKNEKRTLEDSLIPQGKIPRCETPVTEDDFARMECGQNLDDLIEIHINSV